MGGEGEREAPEVEREQSPRALAERFRARGSSASLWVVVGCGGRGLGSAVVARRGGGEALRRDLVRGEAAHDVIKDTVRLGGDLGRARVADRVLDEEAAAGFEAEAQGLVLGLRREARGEQSDGGEPRLLEGGGVVNDARRARPSVGQRRDDVPACGKREGGVSHSFGKIMHMGARVLGVDGCARLGT